MPNSSADPVVAFLTQPKNLASCLEVLKHGEEIRSAGLLHLWECLHAEVVAGIGEANQGAPAKFIVDLRREQVLEKNFWIDIHPSVDVPEGQSLFFRIEHALNARWFEMYYGVHWASPVPRGSAILQLRAVRALTEKQERLGMKFDGNEWWHGRRDAWPPNTRVESLLIEFLEQPASVVEVAAKQLLDHVASVRDLVDRANVALQRKRES